MAIDNGVADLGETVSIDLVLTDAPFGISGYDIQVSIDNPSIAKISGVRFDSTFPLTSEIIASDGSNARIIAADLGNPGSVASGDTDIKFASVRIQGLVEGNTSIRFDSVRIDDDSGNAVNAGLVNGSIQVSNVIPAISAGGDATITEGETFARTGSINDPGDSDFGNGAGAGQPVRVVTPRACGAKRRRAR